jgi:hypothetical protein
MVAYQWMVEKQSKQQVSTVPTPEMLNGDFTFGGIGQGIYDPRTTRQDAQGNWLRDPYPGNIIPRSSWSKVAQNVLGMNPYVLPNRAGSVTTTGVSNNVMSGPVKIVRWDSMSSRIDQQFGPKVKGYATWTGNSRWERQPPWTIASDFFDSSRNIAHTWINTWGAGATT